MDALSLLKSDHDAVRQLFREFEDAVETGDTARQGELCDTITEELQLHTAIEEEVFYPVARDVGGEVEELVLEGIEEHHVVDQLIEELQGLDPAEEAFGAKMSVLIENVEHHAEEEEDELFPMLRDALDAERREELGDALEQAKERAAAAERSKDELYRMAQEQDVHGRSGMTKDELAEAVEE